MDAADQAQTDLLQKAITREATSRGFGDVETRWLSLIVQKDETLPVPVAGAMVERVRELPVGQELAALDSTLQKLKGLSTPEMTTSERRVTEALVQSVISEARSVLAPIQRREV